MSAAPQRHDYDLARIILIYLGSLSASSPDRGGILADFPPEAILFQLNVLRTQGYIYPVKGYTLSPDSFENVEVLKRAVKITEAGNNLLKLIRDERVWHQVKEAIGGKVVKFRQIETLADRFTKKIAKDEKINSKNIAARSKADEKTVKQPDKEEKPPVKSGTKRANGKGGKPSKGEPPIETVSEASFQATEKIVEIAAEDTETAEDTNETVEENAQPAEGSAAVESGAQTPDQIDEYAPTVQTSNIGDAATKEDKLGFKPYVEAIAKFLLDEKTKGPFTLSIEGEWGSGKSSFMLQVEEKLKKEKPGLLTVWFNAWRYDKEDALWAAFATNVVKKLSEQVSREKRFEAKCQLFRRRFDWGKGWFSFLSLFLTAIALFLLAITIIGELWSDSSATTFSAAWFASLLGKDGWAVFFQFLTVSAVGYIILYIFALRKINEFLINPLAADFKKHINAPNYKQRATFLDEFHDDFGKIIAAYAGEGDAAQKVFVFIDDLDRADVPKSAELMQALNLMLSETPQLFFIIGMDREKVAAGLAVKHEKLLQYLNPVTPETAPNYNPGLEYGFEFIEKFIQVPFKIPSPDANNIGRLIAELSENLQSDTTGAQKTEAPADTNSDATLKGEEPADNASNTNEDESTAIDADDTTIPAPPANTEPSKQEAVDSKEVMEVIKTVAPFFDFNPRRIKQFLNIFRLKIFIGNETGLFNQPAADSEFKRINPHILGRFVAISLRYPLLTAEIEDNPKLLKDLQNYAIGGKTTPKFKSYWLDKTRLISLLGENIPKSGDPDYASRTEKMNKYTLLDIDLNKLLLISPSIKTPPTDPNQASTEPEKPSPAQEKK